MTLATLSPLDSDVQSVCALQLHKINLNYVIQKTLFWETKYKQENHIETNAYLLEWAYF